MLLSELFGKKRVVTESSSGKDGVTVHITDTGRIWVDPNEVVRTEAFKKQREAVKRLREAQERAAHSAAM